MIRVYHPITLKSLSCPQYKSCILAGIPVVLSSADREPAGHLYATGRCREAIISDVTAKDEHVEKRSFWRAAGEIVIFLLIAAVIAVLVQSFFLKAFAVTSSSMSPTIQTGDRVMSEKVTYYFRDPKQGDVILFRYPPTDPHAMTTSNPFYWPIERIAETLRLANRIPSPPFVKRVIATGGDTVRIKQGEVYVNGKRLTEKYKVRDVSDMALRKIPKGYIFVMGDNRPNSSDSRVWGLVSTRNVIGKVFLVWWPLGHWHGVN
jgi:signal peptidase I